MTKNVRGWVIGGHQILVFLKTLFLFCVILPVPIRGISERNKKVMQKATLYSKYRPASIAQLDACPTGDQKVAGSTQAESATFFHGD